MTDDTDSVLARARRPLLYAMSAFYVVAGVTHFVVPGVYERIVPPTLPRPRGLVYLSGAAEVTLGLGVLLPRTRRRSAWGLVALLVAVFPANVNMATRGVTPDGIPERYRGIVRAATWLRLPLQGVLMLWAWWYTRPLSGRGE